MRDALRGQSSVVLQAPPGAGKTTRVPLALLDEPWLDGGRIIVLEPRRLAARAAATFMARSLRETVGETVGYRTRLDTRVGPRTRIEVVTEGILTRLVQRDPSLDGVGAVLFDEFHERSVHADLGLALALQTQTVLRPELRIVVMSATLDGARVAALLGTAVPIVTSEGRSWPVEVRWRERRPDDGHGAFERAVAATVREAAQAHDGDVLVFLPGAPEIHRVARLLDGALPRDTSVLPLFGMLAQDAQDAAIASSPPGRRKVVLSTNIAETSLTIDGVRVVVDSGLARVPRFSPRTGMTRLATAPISRASAAQRRGRAGRVAPGVCYRLWSEAEDAQLAAHTAPEIRDADLAPLALDLAAAGVVEPRELAWLDLPPDAAFRQARALLTSLGALSAATGRVTPHGEAMAALPLHPRLAHMVLRGHALGAGEPACTLAALLSERDVVRSSGGAPRGGPFGTVAFGGDVRPRLDLVRRASEGDALPASYAIDHEVVQRVREEARQLWRQLRPIVPRRERARVDAAAVPDDEVVGVLVAFAYPDRIAQRRAGAGDRYLLRSGRGAALASAGSLAGSSYLAVAQLGGTDQESRILLAAPVTLDALLDAGAASIETTAELRWDRESEAVRAGVVEHIGAIVVRDRPDPAPDPDAVVAVMLDVVRDEGLRVLPWSAAASELRDRLRFAHALSPNDWPDVSDEALLATLQDWLAPHLAGLRRRAQLAQLPLVDALLSRLTWPQRAALDALAPTHVVVPSGSRIRVDYANPGAPVLAVRLQEMFGASSTPAVGAGRVPLTLHLLSPAHRPVQVTGDLAGFWRGSYADVRRELRGRYPKHEWPDDPAAATPTARAKRRG